MAKRRTRSDAYNGVHPIAVRLNPEHFRRLLYLCHNRGGLKINTYVRAGIDRDYNQLVDDEQNAAYRLEWLKRQQQENERDE